VRQHRRQFSDDYSSVDFAPVVTTTTMVENTKTSNQNDNFTEQTPATMQNCASEDPACSVESKSTPEYLEAFATVATTEPLGHHSSKPAPADCSPEQGTQTDMHSPIRVKDLVVGDSGTLNPMEDEFCSPVSVKKKPASNALAEMISPEGRKVMKKLETVTYTNTMNDDISPREQGFSDRPWRHDRLIGRVKSMSDEQKAGRCSCSDSLFSGNDEMIEFFLPLTGTACTCGKSQTGLKDPHDPTSLVNILRSWQVEFLGSFGIYRGEDLVKANHRSASALASALRQYRKKMGMTPFRTKSCVTALQIWSKTSKAYVRSMRHQTEANTAANDLRAPNNLYLLSSFLDSVPGDGSSIPDNVAVSGTFGTTSPTSFGDQM